MNVSDYLLSRLKSMGGDHVFGVPGDFVLPFFESLADNDIEHVLTCNELNAGYAADGYARLRGLGAAVVTYGPGAFSIVNAFAGAHAEDVPMVVISGGPDTKAYKSDPHPVLHHLLTDNYEAQINIFKQITEHAYLLDDPQTATAEIDEALAVCLSEKKPVFLEIPKDIQLHTVEEPAPLDIPAYTVANPESTKQAATLLIDRITAGKRTVILPGHEIHRRNLQEKIIQLLQLTDLPAASMFVGKSEYLEHLPNCIGTYQGAASSQEIRDFVEDADTVILLGAVPSDLNLGGFTAKLSKAQTVTVWNNKIDMEQGSFSDVSIVELIDELIGNLPENIGKDERRPTQSFPHKPDSGYKANTDEPLSSKRFYDRLANFIQPNDILLGDAGCAFNLSYTQFPENTNFIASNYWASIGMGFGAALGACFAASDNQRVIAVEGDGSFLMTAQELSSMIRYNKACIVFIVNNKGYTAERFIHDGDFNDIPQWKYHKLPEAFGGGLGVEVRTEGELESALDRAANNRDSLMLIEVHLDPYDVSEGFSSMCEAFRSH